MGEIAPDPGRFRALVKAAKGIEPLHMINLFRFREQADYPTDAPHAPCTGREAYQRYGEAVRPFLEAQGGRAIWSGEVFSALIAPADAHWDYATLIEYPSIGAMIAMSSMEGYAEASVHRTAALLDSRLIVTHPDRPLG